LNSSLQASRNANTKTVTGNII